MQTNTCIINNLTIDTYIKNLKNLHKENKNNLIEKLILDIDFNIDDNLIKEYI